MGITNYCSAQSSKFNTNFHAPGQILRLFSKLFRYLNAIILKNPNLNVAYNLGVFCRMIFNFFRCSKFKKTILNFVVFKFCQLIPYIFKLLQANLDNFCQHLCTMWMLFAKICHFILCTKYRIFSKFFWYLNTVNL